MELGELLRISLAINAGPYLALLGPPHERTSASSELVVQLGECAGCFKLASARVLVSGRCVKPSDEWASQ